MSSEVCHYLFRYLANGRGFFLAPFLRQDAQKAVLLPSGWRRIHAS